SRASARKSDLYLQSKRIPCPGRRALQDAAPAEERGEEREAEEVCERAAYPVPEVAAREQAEHRRAGGAKDAEVVERPEQHVAPGQRCRRAEDGMGGGAAVADREREHALLLMAVVRDDAPADAVVAVGQLRLQWDRQHSPP